MNPLIPQNALQIRYTSSIFEPICDEEDNIIDEECVREGTNVLHECIVAVSKDKLPRYYRLRYRENAKEHKRKWERYLEDNLIHGSIPYFVRAKKIGRRVLFEYDPTLIEKREKKLRAIQHKKEMEARKLARQKPEVTGPQEEESWEEFMHKLKIDFGIQGIRAVEQRRIVDEIPIIFQEDDDEVLILEDDDDIYVGETEQGGAVYEDRESGDRYEER